MERIGRDGVAAAAAGAITFVAAGLVAGAASLAYAERIPDNYPIGKTHGPGEVADASGLVVVALLACAAAVGVRRARRQRGGPGRSGSELRRGVLGGAALGALVALGIHATLLIFTWRASFYIFGPPQTPSWWPSALVAPVIGALCGLALGLLTGNEKRPITTTG